MAGLILALLALTAGAQQYTVISGHISIERVGIPNDRLEVTLAPLLGGASQKTFSDVGGKFAFAVTRPGTYLVTVKAPYKSPYKDGSAEVRVDRVGRAYSVSVSVVLETDAPATTTTPSAGTVSIEEIQQSVPSEARRLYELGSEKAAAGRAEEAVVHFREALAIAPRYLFALNDLGVQLLKLNRLEEAVLTLREAITIAPRSFSPRLNLALALFGHGRPAEAAPEIDRALEINPDHPNALFVDGKIERALGNREAAVQAFTRAYITSAGQVALAMIELGQLYEEAGETELAVDAYATYLEGAPDGPYAAYARSRLQTIGAAHERTRGATTRP